MAWGDLATNQCVSFNNLQSAVNIGIFAQLNSIPASSEQITKSDASFYAQIDTGYSPFQAKSSNQLVVQSDLRPSWSGSATWWYIAAHPENYGWNDSTDACANYTNGSATTIYWNTSLAVSNAFFVTIYVNPTYTYVVMVGGNPYWMTFNYNEYVLSAGTYYYKYTITALTDCAPTAYTWFDSKVGNDFSNICFELSDTYYTSTPTIGVGTVLYYNPSLTIAVGGYDYFSTPSASSGLIWTMDGFGTITGDTGSTC